MEKPLIRVKHTKVGNYLGYQLWTSFLCFKIIVFNMSAVLSRMVASRGNKKKQSKQMRVRAHNHY